MFNHIKTAPRIDGIDLLLLMTSKEILIGCWKSFGEESLDFGAWYRSDGFGWSLLKQEEVIGWINLPSPMLKILDEK